jgi:mono/diheme cytochrome c family protein
MQSKTLLLTGAIVASMFLFSQCNEQPATTATITNGGYESQVKWGEHLLRTGGCGDCHTPKKMTEMGPVDDSTLMLSGHPSQYPLPDIDRSILESKGMFASQTLTFWMGPWGVSFAANLTPDSTGTLAWTEDQFKTALREGYSKGIKNNRRLLPPMPVEATKNFTDDEIKAIFAYIRTVKPIKNIVPQPLPPVSAPPPPPAK